MFPRKILSVFLFAIIFNSNVFCRITFVKRSLYPNGVSYVYRQDGSEENGYSRSYSYGYDNENSKVTITSYGAPVKVTSYSMYVVHPSATQDIKDFSESDNFDKNYDSYDEEVDENEYGKNFDFGDKQFNIDKELTDNKYQDFYNSNNVYDEEDYKKYFLQYLPGYKGIYDNENHNIVESFKNDELGSLNDDSNYRTDFVHW